MYENLRKKDIGCYRVLLTIILRDQWLEDLENNTNVGKEINFKCRKKYENGKGIKKKIYVS
jgi:hypothetical protein